MNLEKISNLLDTYTLEDIFELNDLTSEDVLFFLVEEEFLTLPKPEPMDFEND